MLLHLADIQTAVVTLINGALQLQNKLSQVGHDHFLNVLIQRAYEERYALQHGTGMYIRHVCQHM